ncbi:MAG: hypothetical protein M3O70_21530 [Actinomycetota bacterium]|nr:hypothetical protein [Actinomycetota bacterium]
MSGAQHDEFGPLRPLGALLTSALAGLGQGPAPKPASHSVVSGGSGAGLKNSAATFGEPPISKGPGPAPPLVERLTSEAGDGLDVPSDSG